MAVLHKSSDDVYKNMTKVIFLLIWMSVVTKGSEERKGPIEDGENCPLNYYYDDHYCYKCREGYVNPNPESSVICKKIKNKKADISEQDQHAPPSKHDSSFAGTLGDSVIELAATTNPALLIKLMQHRYGNGKKNNVELDSEIVFGDLLNIPPGDPDQYPFLKSKPSSFPDPNQVTVVSSTGQHATLKTPKREVKEETTFLPVLVILSVILAILAVFALVLVLIIMQCKNNNCCYKGFTIASQQEEDNH